MVYPLAFSLDENLQSDLANKILESIFKNLNMIIAQESFVSGDVLIPHLKSKFANIDWNTDEKLVGDILNLTGGHF